jgi:integrase
VPYDLRHTFATRVAQENIDLPTLAALLEHASIRMVQKYVHPPSGHNKTAMALYDIAIKRAARKSRSELQTNLSSVAGAEEPLSAADPWMLNL